MIKQDPPPTGSSTSSLLTWKVSYSSLRTDREVLKKPVCGSRRNFAWIWSFDLSHWGPFVGHDSSHEEHYGPNYAISFVVIGPFKIDKFSISWIGFISLRKHYLFIWFTLPAIILSLVTRYKTNNENWKISVLFIELLKWLENNFGNWTIDHFWWRLFLQRRRVFFVFRRNSQGIIRVLTRTVGWIRFGLTRIGRLARLKWINYE